MAMADPFTVGISVVSFFGLQAGIAGSIVVGSIVLGGLAVGAQLAIGALTPRPGASGGGSASDPGQFSQTFEANEGSAIIGVGRCRIGGLIAFGNTNEFDRYRLVLHSQSQFDGIEEHILGGRAVTVEVGGGVSSPPYVTSSGSFINITNTNGTDDILASQELIDQFPALWTADHRLRGITQSLVRYTSPGQTDPLFPRLYSEGAPPYTPLARWSPVYDPRDVSQDPADETTWVWSENGILVCNFILSLYPQVTPDIIDFELMAQEADRADVLVPTLTGTAPRSRLGGVFELERPRNEVMTEMLSSAGAEIVETEEGKYYVRLIDELRPPTLHIEAKHIISIVETNGLEAVERDNVARVQYFAPERNYQLSEINLDQSEWATVDVEVDRYGIKEGDFEFPFCIDASQAQRNARREFLLRRAETGVLITNLVGILSFRQQTISYEDFDTNETVVIEIGEPRINDEQGQVTIPFVKQPTDRPYDASIDESPAPAVISEIPADSSLAQPDPVDEAFSVTYPNGDVEFRVFYDLAPETDVSEAVFNRIVGGNQMPQESLMEETGVGFAFQDIDLVGEAVNVRHRFFDADQESSSFSDDFIVDPVTINNTQPGPPDVSNIIAPGGNVAGFNVTTVQRNVVRIFVTRRTGSGESAVVFDTNTRPFENSVVAFVDGQGTTTYEFFTQISDGTVSPPFVFAD